ncbi:YrbL family protein [Aliarcobacter trophiarum]|uniref:YrbL family protein n=1 Tax=Aliarcobacter trophiarum TaxID=708186 RepID=UPI00100B9CEB|nr:YrbL family protein [Aliarcobacter trophiarum]RXI28674.1 hypothetical protein CRU89_01595 [Aliarcobacter trophiarum]
MNEKIVLTEEFLVARGGERDCYIHPLDSTKVIKVLYINNKINRNQNTLEYKYFKFLEKQNVPLSHITKCYGYIDTDLGEGLIFDRVYDYDGKTSMTFLDIIIKNRLTKDVRDKMVEELKEYLFKYNILFVDIALYNVLCCEYEKDRYKLVIIDGLGGRRVGIKFFLYLNSKIFTKYKIRKSWKRFLVGYNKKR